MIHKPSLLAHRWKIQLQQPLGPLHLMTLPVSYNYLIRRILPAAFFQGVKKKFNVIILGETQLLELLYISQEAVLLLLAASPLLCQQETPFVRPHQETVIQDKNLFFPVRINEK